MIARSTMALGAALFSSSPSLAQLPSAEPGKWRPVVYADLQLPGEAAIPYASLWADELRRNNDAYKAKGDLRWLVANAPAAESHVVIRSPERVVVLSVLHTLAACTLLRRDSPHAILKSCPMRLAIYENGRSRVADAGRGCFIEYPARQGNSAPDMVRNAALAAYDIEHRTIRAGIVFQGKAAEECQFRVPIPQF